ncbi:MAG: Ig-like domain-containing protein, partial [Candidatus Aenigmarchaeota archaeon]|nr:Ig-like domain-containing protein [Candidatus Aenigmarchaeota archaeon]
LLPLITGGSRTFTCQQQLNLELEIIPERYTLLRNEIFQITSRVYSGSSFINGATVTFTYRFNDGSTTTNLGSSSCTTNQNGECTVQYNTPNIYGSLIITANAQYQNYLPASNELTINVVDCFADQNCRVYEYCSNRRCIDLRPMASSCNYFDYCENGRVPGTQQPCVWGEHCYSRNVDQQLTTQLCNDAGYRAHALVINCGGG